MVVAVTSAATGLAALAEQPDQLQWHFMQDEELQCGESFQPLFVSTASNAAGQRLCDLHQEFNAAVGGISATVVPGNSAGYIGGLTASKTMAEAIYLPSAGQASVGRNEAELRAYLQAAGLRTDVPLAGGALSFRDYRHMRTGAVVPAVAKTEGMVPCFGPCAWERLHGLLRSLAFNAPRARPWSTRELMFCTESEAQLRQRGLVATGAGLALVQCYFAEGELVVEGAADPSAPVAPLQLSDATRAAIISCMNQLQLVYSNAVFDGVTSIEDCGWACTHVFSELMRMADSRYQHPRNRALVYCVGPNGHRQRYPTDVHELPTVASWHERTELTGRNISRSVAAYNTARLAPTITVLRTCLVSGGAFLLRDLATPPNLLVTLQEHAASYQSGLLQGCVESGLRRVELMHTPGPAGDDAFAASFRKSPDRSLTRAWNSRALGVADAVRA